MHIHRHLCERGRDAKGHSRDHSSHFERVVESCERTLFATQALHLHRPVLVGNAEAEIRPPVRVDHMQHNDHTSLCHMHVEERSEVNRRIHLGHQRGQGHAESPFALFAFHGFSHLSGDQRHALLPNLSGTPADIRVVRHM